MRTRQGNRRARECSRERTKTYDKKYRGGTEKRPMAFKTIKLEFEGEIATITLNRPKKRNAISTEMIEELPRALDEVEKGPTRVAILTGAGNAFCAGMDLDEQRNLSSLTHEQHLAATRRIAEMFRSVYTFPKPLI